jgi:hypothetical protein
MEQISGGSSFTLIQLQQKEEDGTHVEVLNLTVTQQSFVLFTVMFTLILLHALETTSVLDIRSSSAYTAKFVTQKFYTFVSLGQAI